MEGEAVATKLGFMDYDVTFGTRMNMKKSNTQGQRQQGQQQQRIHSQHTISSMIAEIDSRSRVLETVSLSCGLFDKLADLFNDRMSITIRTWN